MLGRRCVRLVRFKSDSAMKRRLEQLAEDAAPSSADPRAGVPQDALPLNDSVMDENDIDKLIKRIENSDYDIQRQISMSRVPGYAGRDAQETAMADVWTGEEKPEDVVLRALMEKHKKKSVRHVITPPVPLKERISQAREKSLDYKLAKVSQKTSFEEDPNFREMYRERLLGPNLLVSDTFAGVNNAISSMANQKIEEARQRGEFKSIPRGKPLPRDFHNENAFIDRTEYHLNKILKKQDAIPPWIEKQGSVNVLIQKFREELDREWRKKAVSLICEKYPVSDLDEKQRMLQRYIRAEDGENRGEQLRNAEWEDAQRQYLKAKINSLNDSIRGYNLQAPLASQKFYLDVERELRSSYRRVAHSLPEALKRHVLGRGYESEDMHQESAESRSVFRKRAPTYREVYQKHTTYQVPSESLGKMFLKLFKGE